MKGQTEGYMDVIKTMGTKSRVSRKTVEPVPVKKPTLAVTLSRRLITKTKDRELRVSIDSDQNMTLIERTAHTRTGHTKRQWTEDRLVIDIIELGKIIGLIYGERGRLHV